MVCHNRCFFALFLGKFNKYLLSYNIVILYNTNFIIIYDFKTIVTP